MAYTVDLATLTSFMTSTTVFSAFSIPTISCHLPLVKPGAISDPEQQLNFFFNFFTEVFFELFPKFLFFFLLLLSMLLTALVTGTTLGSGIGVIKVVHFNELVLGAPFTDLVAVYFVFFLLQRCN